MFGQIIDFFTILDMTKQFLLEIVAHDAVDQDSNGRIQRHGQVGGHAEHDKPQLGREAVDLTHVHLFRGVLVGERFKQGHVVGAKHETKFLLKKKRKST